MDSPEELEALADRIDPEELWRRRDTDAMTPEQKDRMMAAVCLRRYATDLVIGAEERKEGAEYIRGARLERADMSTDRRGCGDGDWHRAIVAYSDDERYFPRPATVNGVAVKHRDWPRMMYLAKTISDEVPRAIMLFQAERERRLPSAYKMCGHDPRPAKPLPDNHLRCALGKECRKCPHLLALDNSIQMTPEAKDEAKAWTCATHFLIESGTSAVFLEELIYDKSTEAFTNDLHRF